MKYNEGKPRMSLVYKSFMEAVSRVRQYGVEKHGAPEDWRTTPPLMHFDACLRHVFAHLDGEELDEGSELPHLAHAACCLMFEIERNYGSLKLGSNGEALPTWSPGDSPFHDDDETFDPAG